MVADRVLRYLNPGQRNDLFTIQELKEIAVRRKGGLNEAHKATCEEAKLEYTKRISTCTQTLTVNTDFFKRLYENAANAIQALFKESVIKQVNAEAMPAHAVYPNKSLGNYSRHFEAKGKIREIEGRLSKRFEKRQMKGAHWNEKEKQHFIKCLRKYGKNWNAITSEFQSKTIKQLRNFYQNNKEKLRLSDYPYTWKSGTPKHNS